MSRIDFSRMITRQERARQAATIRRDRDAAQAAAYLGTTDWYLIRQTETGQPVPEAVRKQRAAARGLMATGRT